MSNKRKLKWRATLRALHRDAGYLAVGLTVVYALSGLAVNHISDWDPNYENIEEEHTLSETLPAEPRAAAARVLDAIGHSDTDMRDAYRPTDTRLVIVFDRKTVHVDESTHAVVVEGQEPRFMLKAMNWLHLNRGKKAWTFIADAYAVLLLFLALGGIFMIKGSKGIRGRGAVLVAVGAAIPVGFVVFS